jgi:hypothetical protein
MLPGPWPTQSLGWANVAGEVSLRPSAAGDVISTVVGKGGNALLAQLTVKPTGVQGVAYSPPLNGPLFGALRHDGAGRTIVIEFKFVQTVAPDGALLDTQYLEPLSYDGTLADDGAVYLMTQSKLTSLQITPAGKLSINWQTLGPANYPFDGASPGWLFGGSKLLTHLSVGGSQRELVGLTLPGVVKPASGWFQTGGSYQRLYSLKAP